MSGGPVFDVEGKVRGMAAATVSRTVPDPSGSLTVVPNGVVIDLEHIQRILHAAITTAATSEA
jgi:S1-C subfamily serine protease